MSDTVLLGSITDLRPQHSGAIVVSGSHGGIFPAALASRGGVRGVIFNDAGGGLDCAGVAGVHALAKVGCAAAAVDCMSCCIGSAEDMVLSGRLSTVNAVAAQLGLAPGQPVTDAAEMLAHAPLAKECLPEPNETRQRCVLPSGLSVELLDSASMVESRDKGRIVVTGSHGALIGGDSSRALKAHARLAIFNDAGGGKGGIGMSRLPALEAQGIAAATVSYETARIGDAASALSTGVLSSANAGAQRMGARTGMLLSEVLNALPGA